MSIEATSISEAYPFLRHSVRETDKPSILLLGIFLYARHIVNDSVVKSFKCSVVPLVLHLSTRSSFNSSSSVNCFMFPIESGLRHAFTYMCVHCSINWVGMKTSCTVLTQILVVCCESLLLYWTTRVNCGRGRPVEPHLLQAGPKRPTSCGVITIEEYQKMDSTIQCNILMGKNDKFDKPQLVIISKYKLLSKVNLFSKISKILVKIPVKLHHTAHHKSIELKNYPSRLLP